MDAASVSAVCRLGASAALAEQGFLSAGQCLEAAITVLDRLAERFSRYIAEQTGEALGVTHHDLAAAGTHVAALAAARDSEVTALDVLSDIVAATGHRVAALLPVPREVETLSLCARVVAGGMGEAGADFAIFAGDIRVAAQQARSCLDGACLSLGRLEHDVAAARAAAQAFVQQHGAAMTSIPRRLADNLHGLAVHQQVASKAAVTARQQSEQVRNHVAEQIVALQLGDITRQRLEHVQAAAQLLAEAGCQAGHLLAAQLTDTADELDREGDHIECGLRELTAAARTIGLLGVEVRGESLAGGFVAALEADIRKTAELFAELNVGDAATDQRMAAVLAAAGALTGRLASVQSVQEDIRIMGLNATLRCGRLGSTGRALAAVAQELRLCSGRFGASAALVLDDLERLRPIASGLSDASRRAQHAELARAADEMLVPLRRLSQLEHELADGLTNLQADAAEVGQLVDRAVVQFAVRHGLAQTLRDAATEFAGDTGADECTREQLDRIAAGYTMTRERDVHVRFASLPQLAAPVQDEDVLF